MLQDKTRVMLQEILKEVSNELSEVASDLLWYHNQTNEPSSFLIKKTLNLVDQIKTIEEAMKLL